MSDETHYCRGEQKRIAVNQFTVQNDGTWVHVKSPADAHDDQGFSMHPGAGGVWVYDTMGDFAPPESGPDQ